MAFRKMCRAALTASAVFAICSITLTPVMASGIVQDITAGGVHTCALAGARVACWGKASVPGFMTPPTPYGSLGLGTGDAVGDNEVPTDYSPAPGKDNFIDFSGIVGRTRGNRTPSVFMPFRIPRLSKASTGHGMPGSAGIKSFGA